MRTSLRRRFGVLLLALTALTAVGCFQLIYKMDVRRVDTAAKPAGEGTRVRAPLKVHLADGSTVIFRDGAMISREVISGNGQRFALLSADSTPQTVVPVDSVVGVESFEGKLLALPTIIVSAAATVLGTVLTAGLLVALFGSCPTIYADTGDGLTLQAEGFSYSIAPLLESRDVDALRVRPDADGVIRLELRNEALETHFINHVELLSVRHPVGTQVVPDQSGRPVQVGGFARVTRARDRAGRDVRRSLASADGVLFSSAAKTVVAASEGDLDDWIDLDIAGLPAGDSVAVVLRLRNSLLNTVLMYEGMLGGHDAIDWMSSGLQHIASTVDFSRWYVRTMGMRAFVDGVPSAAADSRLGTARLGDVGPIAFRDVALILPRAAADTGAARVRLRFVADNWRIDEVRVGGTLGRPAVQVLPVERIEVPVPARGDGPVVDVAAERAIADADDRYLETRPGQRMTLVFRPLQDDGPAGSAAVTTTTNLIAWQGWYREWVRGSWIAEPKRTSPFVPGDLAILTALRRWSAQQKTLEREFYSSRLPVR